MIIIMKYDTAQNILAIHGIIQIEQEGGCTSQKNFLQPFFQVASKKNSLSFLLYKNVLISPFISEGYFLPDIEYAVDSTFLAGLNNIL